MNRIEREKNIVSQMIALYCRRHHEENEMCAQCRELAEYAMHRLDLCPKGTRKSSCRKCEIHCYSPNFRERIRTVMRFMGPRMIFISPIASLRHLWD
ncbi:MAG: nitrous oxide-stimulated promoter family protein, partial [Paramuribaculum sp.]|nr:nitrous oxide-stimulated promoter family protein [Paramuribaculum sp.]